MDLSEFDYALPRERIAQRPLDARDAARLLVLDRARDARTHSRVIDLPDWLAPGDLLVVNASRVVPARLRGRKASGGSAEALLLGAEPDAPGRYRALLRCRGRVRVGQKLRFADASASLDAEVVRIGDAGEFVLAFAPGASPYRLGEAPLPPYIRRTAPDPADADRYQTIFARAPGSVAAPTAGLHFSDTLMRRLAERGIESAEIVLHVGPGTFRPLRPEDLAAGRLHAEDFELPEATAAAVEAARARGARVVAVGTTSARVLETCAGAARRVRPGSGRTELLLRPGSEFRVVDALLTNFHLPRSSLLLLVAAFAGRQRVLEAYAEAVQRAYRFYSYGDAMLIL
ncbi:MAG: tRNA preQ1(34) S-adenosylmethionine ribosyltransferase-isomerase QueA [Deltaproteobacteria bacterium]|nr:MAG: tRNA preQ1(34) S-adenosylmethionine ribosyltransferase-isomerase QueA [Deltaproteobacteria bacterium]